MVNKVQLDPNAGQDVDVEFEADPNAELQDSPTHESEENGDEATEAAPTQQEQDDLEAAGVNIDEAAENKARKREHKALMKDVKEYGTLYGGGKTSMINLAERLVEGAQKKAVTADDAQFIYDTFKKAADAKATTPEGVIEDAAVQDNAPIVDNEESYKAQIAKIENFITLGNTFDEEGAGAVDLIRRAKSIHFELLKGNRETLKKGSTYTILCGVAATHVGKYAKRKVSQGPMTDEELRDWLWVAPKPEADPADEWKKVEDALNAAKAAKRGGRGENRRAPITSDTLAGQHLDNAIHELRECLHHGAPNRLQKIEAEEAEAQRKADDAEAKKNEPKKGRGKAKAA